MITKDKYNTIIGVSKMMQIRVYFVIKGFANVDVVAPLHACEMNLPCTAPGANYLAYFYDRN